MVHMVCKQQVVRGIQTMRSPLAKEKGWISMNIILWYANSRWSEEFKQITVES